MGIVNTTPDSFSDGGEFVTADRAIAHGLQLANEGAKIIDIGGESTRPMAQTVNIVKEIARIEAVVRGLAGKAPFISIDTRNAATMRVALDRGANFINDISALTHSPEAMSLLAPLEHVPICLMHMRGAPATMQIAPVYGDVVREVMNFLIERIAACEKAGIARRRLVVDPGIGFGKTAEQNLALLSAVGKFKTLGCPVLIGTSRKSFIAAVTQDGTPPKNRIGGSLATAIAAVERGVDILRVHDVAATAQAVQVHEAIKQFNRQT